jgi:transposase InsO family protein
MVSPIRRRDAVAFLVRRHKVSERRACQVVGQHRSTQRYVAVPGDFEVRLVKAMRQLAEEHPRWGYRRIHVLLVDAGWPVNLKRVERLWRLEGLRVPDRNKHRATKGGGSDANSAWALPAVRPNHVWSYDFVAARTVDGGPLRILNIVDEFTREAVASHVARSIGARDVVKVLDKTFAGRATPAIIRSDNGREFTAATVVDWLTDRGVTAAFIEKASPQQNCYVERFNGSMRDELLDGELFHSVVEARVVIGQWLEIYNHSRPHRGLGMMTPAAFAATQ